MARRARPTPTVTPETIDTEMTEALSDAVKAELQRAVDILDSVGRVIRAGLRAGQTLEHFEKTRILYLEKVQRRLQAFFEERPLAEV